MKKNNAIYINCNQNSIIFFNKDIKKLIIYIITFKYSIKFFLLWIKKIYNSEKNEKREKILFLHQKTLSIIKKGYAKKTHGFMQQVNCDIFDL